MNGPLKRPKADRLSSVRISHAITKILRRPRRRFCFMI
ncbi:hypothetical protein CHCC20335_2123 [Bacillus paralicheniformis]|nr:hypothetical protein CHCC20335_2123 [Bacillus paralicheniformis]